MYRRLDQSPQDLSIQADLNTAEEAFWSDYLAHCSVERPRFGGLRVNNLGSLGQLIRKPMGRFRRRKPAPGKISVIISTYASAAFIADALADVAAQRCSNPIEIVVVDACSPEHEGEIVRRFRSRFESIVYVRTPARIGVYPAWNLALCLASGAYVTTLSSNDRLSPDAYRLLGSALDSDPSVSLVYGDSYVTEHPHQSFDSFIPAREHSKFLTWPDYRFEDLLGSCGIGPHPMWRKTLHQEVGYFDCRYSAVSDQDFWLRVGARARIRHLRAYTGLFWLTASGVSQSPNASAELAEIRQRHQNAFTLPRVACPISAGS